VLGDSALADLVASGDERAFEVLYERHRAEIFRYCRALMRHPQDAEEAFQLTMLSAYGRCRRAAAPSAICGPGCSGSPTTSAWTCCGRARARRS